MRDYTKIEAWKLADYLTVDVYQRTRLFPTEEVYGLTSQLRRASYSVPANMLRVRLGKARRTTCISVTLHADHFRRRNISYTSRRASDILHPTRPRFWRNGR